MGVRLDARFVRRRRMRPRETPLVPFEAMSVLSDVAVCDIVIAMRASLLVQQRDRCTVLIQKLTDICETRRGNPR